MLVASKNIKNGQVLLCIAIRGLHQFYKSNPRQETVRLSCKTMSQKHPANPTSSIRCTLIYKWLRSEPCYTGTLIHKCSISGWSCSISFLSLNWTKSQMQAPPPQVPDCVVLTKSCVTRQHNISRRAGLLSIHDVRTNQHQPATCETTVWWNRYKLNWTVR